MSHAISNEDARNGRILDVRRRIAGVSHRANSAHLGSSLSCVEILDSVLNAAGLTSRSLVQLDRTRVILSKGHAAMALYASLEAWGLLEHRHLDHYLENGTDLWGHATRTPAAPIIDVSTGSLGHGLGLAVGFGLGHRLRNWSSRVFAVISDGECDEGSTWEAAHYAGHHALSNVCAIVDYNKIQSIGRVEDVLALEPFADKWLSFGWAVTELDGHDWAALDDAIAQPSSGPKVILAHTVKGKGLKRIEDTVASHYHPAKLGDPAEIEAYYA